MAGGQFLNKHIGDARTVFQAGAVHGNVVMLPQPSVLPGVSEAQLTLARHLAGQVRTLSEKELEQWGVRDIDAVSVRWHTAAEDVLDHWENIHGDPGRGDPVPLSGSFTAIRDTYQAISSKRLVILGRAGAGKTVLAHRLILDLIDNTETAVAVPVLFSLSDWNPTTTGLRAWLVQQLVRDFPFLDQRDPTTRKGAAEALVDSGLLLPVLDGFDEIPNEHHQDAIAGISNIDRPLVVTSRPEEYAEAARTIRAVGGAAAIELEDLTLDEARRYLWQSTSRNRAPAWDTVFDHIRTAPEDTASHNLTSVLRTPLMVMLSRTTYNDAPGRDPRELLDTQRFPTHDHLEKHLLNTYLTTLYTHQDDRGTRHPNWAPENARRWLGHLAAHLTRRNTHDLTWWHLPATLHSRTRILVTTITIGLPFALASGLPTGLDWGLATGLFSNGLRAGLATGLASGLMFGLLNETRFPRRSGLDPESLRLRLRRRGGTRRPQRNTSRKIAGGLAAGGMVGLAYGLANGLAYNPAFGTTNIPLTYGLAFGLVFGLVFGLMFGFVNVIVSALGDSHDPHTTDPWTLLSRDRTVTLVRTIATALVFGFVFGLTGRLASELASGLSIGLLDGGLAFDLADSFTTGLKHVRETNLLWSVPLTGLPIGAGRLLLSAWGNWLLFTRLWLPLTGRLPWRPKRFLDDAYQRGVLRRAGAVYQFRHAQLRDHLATHYRARSGRRRSSPVGSAVGS